MGQQGEVIQSSSLGYEFRARLPPVQAESKNQIDRPRQKDRFLLGRNCQPVRTTAISMATIAYEGSRKTPPLQERQFPALGARR
jgi:hypothetical protein